MVLKVVDATELRVGTACLIEGDAYTVKKMDISKTGKHGHAKCRIEAASVTSGKKKVLVVPGHDKFEIPLIEKKKAQVLTISNGHANLMDSESFENIDLIIPEELVSEIKEGGEVEYWDIEEGKEKLIKRSI
jgi:translation initiation factor 5A